TVTSLWDGSCTILYRTTVGGENHCHRVHNPSGKDASRRVTLRSLSLCTWTVHNPPGRDSHRPERSHPCEMDPVQSLYRMTAELVDNNIDKHRMWNLLKDNS
nr:hypothetical protein [Endozoicomonas sp.]